MTPTIGSSTDSFGFNGLKLFEVVRDCLPDDRKRTQNLLETKDDMLFVWNSKNCSVLTVNWRAANVKKDQQQKYQVGVGGRIPAVANPASAKHNLVYSSFFREASCFDRGGENLSE